jgi:hypothetical protein
VEEEQGAMDRLMGWNSNYAGRETRLPELDIVQPVGSALWSTR